MSIKRLYTLLFIFSSIYAQGLRVVHMEGTYDLDGDRLQEFATIEKGLLNNNSVSLIRYYEINNDGYQQMNWELKAPDGLLGNFVDVELGDLNGDGTPELITVSNLAEPNQNELLQPIAFYYSWDGEKFNETAGGVSVSYTHLTLPTKA